MLTITNVRKTFNKGTINEKKALNGINLHLESGDFVTIIGGNGAGKSTMLNMIAGVYPIDSGKIVDVYKRQDKDSPRSGIPFPERKGTITCTLRDAQKR